MNNEYRTVHPAARSKEEGDNPTGPSRKTDAPLNEDAQREFFNKVRAALTVAAGKLFEPFLVLEGSIASGRSFDEAEFYEKFLIYSNEFASECCASCASLTREMTLVPQTRGTPTKQLAKELRSQAFDRLDSIFVEAFTTLQKCGLDLAEANEKLANTDVTSAAIGGALAGGAIGSLVNRSRTGAILGAGAAASQEITRQYSYQKQAFYSLVEARETIALKIQEWLECVVDMPDALLDWVGAKCFGGGIDLALQQECQCFVADVFTAHVERAKCACDSNKRLRVEEYERKIAQEQKTQQETERAENEVVCKNCGAAYDSRGKDKCPECGYIPLGLSEILLCIFVVSMVCGLPDVFTKPNGFEGLLVGLIPVCYVGFRVIKKRIHNQQCRKTALRESDGDNKPEGEKHRIGPGEAAPTDAMHADPPPKAEGLAADVIDSGRPKNEFVFYILLAALIATVLTAIGLFLAAQ